MLFFHIPKQIQRVTADRACFRWGGGIFLTAKAAKKKRGDGWVLRGLIKKGCGKKDIIASDRNKSTN
jgi:hypothetical protein